MAKVLLARRNGIDWGGVMEQICVYTLRKLREQDAVAHIGSLPMKPLKFRLRPVLPEGTITLLYGYGGVAKTTIAMAWGLLVSSGIPMLGLEPIRGPVLLLDWETNLEIANNTQRAIAGGLNLPGVPEFFYLRCRSPLTDIIESVEAIVKREGIVLGISDSMVKACGGDK